MVGKRGTIPNKYLAGSLSRAPFEVCPPYVEMTFVDIHISL
jgi:hypothetical protein